MAFLCISLNNSSVDTLHLMDGELRDIDKYTTTYSGAKEILNNFPDKVEELKDIYNLDSDKLNIMVRIFLANDKEQIVLYNRHLTVFKIIIKDINFLRYIVNYEPNLFNKELKNIILDEQIAKELVSKTISKYISSLSDDEYYDVLRKVCNEYMNYIEDETEEQLPSMDEIYTAYLEKTSTENINIPNEPKEKSQKSPFAVFEHPNFFKKYGSAIDSTKPIFILGSMFDENSKLEYKYIENNLKKCFFNPLYSPFNFNISFPLNDKFKEVYSTSILVVVNANGYDENLCSKIEYASTCGITIIILVNNDQIKDLYLRKFANNDTILIMDYIFNNYDSDCEFARIMVGIYIKKYKELKESVG